MEYTDLNLHLQMTFTNVKTRLFYFVLETRKHASKILYLFASPMTFFLSNCLTLNFLTIYFADYLKIKANDATFFSVHFKVTPRAKVTHVKTTSYIKNSNKFLNCVCHLAFS